MLLTTGSALGPQPSRANPSILDLSDEPTSHQELEEIFTLHNYDWRTLENGVPSLFLKTLPQDLAQISQTQKKKTVFFLSILPVVLRVNEEIKEQKRDLRAILARYDQEQSLSVFQQTRLAAIAADYKISGDPLSDPEARETLLKRVDIIPPSMVLAQAATESAYGTSRLAQVGNNLFGECTFIPGTGIVPLNQSVDLGYEYKSFATIYESVASYMKNLNTHWAYQTLRNLRSSIRAENRPLRGEELAQGLLRYSERGEAYVQQVRAIIRSNALHRLASAMFRPRMASAEEEEASTFSAGLLATPLSRSRNQRCG